MKMKMKEFHLGIQNRNYIPGDQEYIRIYSCGDTMRVGGDSLHAPVQLTCLALTFMLSIFFNQKH